MNLDNYLDNRTRNSDTGGVYTYVCKCGRSCEAIAPNASVCDECKRLRRCADAAARRKAHPERNAVWNRKFRTGWTEEMVAAAWERQHGRCARCNVKMLKRGKQQRSVRCERGVANLGCFGCWRDVYFFGRRHGHLL